MSARIYSLEEFRQSKIAEAVSMNDKKVASGGTKTTLVRRVVRAERPVKPFVRAGHSVLQLRDKLVPAINKFDPQYLLMPATKDLDPFWAGLTVEKAWFNAVYPPLSFMHMMLRDHPQAFTETIRDVEVNFLQDYHRTMNNFNNLYMRGIEGRGRSREPQGALSEDQGIRLSTLLYILLRTADMSEGIQIDSMGHFCNEWSGNPKKFSPKYLDFRKYSDRMKTSYYTGLPAQQFLFRAIPEYKSSRSTWIFDLSDVDILNNDQNYAELDYQGLVGLLDTCSSSLSATHNQTVVVLKYSEEMMSLLRGSLPRRLHLDTSFGHRTIVVTNFDF
jgi:hypothetical protein